MKSMTRLLVIGLSLTVNAVLGGDAPVTARPEVRKQVLELTGGREARIVWIRDAPDVTGTVMAFDTASGGERVLVPGVKGALLLNPFFTRDGKQVVYSNVKEKAAYIVGFDVTGHRQLKFKRPGFNFVLGLASDASTGEEFIYVGDNFALTAESRARAVEQMGGFSAWGNSPGKIKEDHGSAVYRYNLKRLDAEPELVWDKMPVGYRTVVSPDGKYLVGEMPWPRLLVAPLPSGMMRQYALGCCPMVLPIDILCGLGGEHQNIWMYTWEGKSYAIPPANTMPGLTGKRDIWRPKMAANDGHFLVVKSYHEDSAGGDVYFGRFSADFRRIEGWAQISGSTSKSTKEIVSLDTVGVDLEGVSGNTAVNIAAGDFDMQAAPPDKVVNKEAAAWITPSREKPAVKTGTASAAAPAQAVSLWPVRQDGLLFRWSSGNTVAEPPLALNASGQPIFAYRLTANGRALLGADFEMIPAGGSYQAAAVGPFLAQSWKAAGMLGIEAYVTPQDTARTEAGEIMSFGSKDGRYAFLLVQERNKLLLGVLTSAAKAVEPGTLTEIATLPDARAVHLFVGHAGDNLACFLNGKSVYAGRLAGDYANWPGDAEILFGASGKGERRWWGRLEKVAFYRQALSPEEVAAHAAAVATIVAARPAVERLVIEATLLQRTKTRTDIDPYSRALGHYEYRVDKVISGYWREPRIHVMHWTVMDRKPLPIAARPIEKSYTLVLEPFGQQPQLRAELQQDDIDWDYTKPLYYDVDTR
jgi:hypothetical protein